MASEKKTQIYRIVVVFLLTLISFSLLFVLVKNKNVNQDILGEFPISEEIELAADIEVDSIVENEDGTYTVNYAYTFTNHTNGIINDLVATNDIASNFDPIEVSITSLSSDSLVLNNSFDGNSDLNLLLPGQSINNGETAVINLSITFDPGEDVGPFENEINVSGQTFEQLPRQGNNDGGEEEEEENEPPVIPPDNDGDGVDDGGNDNNNNTPDPDEEEVEEEIIPENLTVTLVLVNADTDTIIGPITDGQVIDLYLIGGNISVEAVLNEGINGSVIFGLNNNSSYRIENTSPYAIGGNTGSNFAPWNVSTGDHQLSANVYSGASGQGTLITSQIVNISIIDSTPGINVSNSASVSFTLNNNSNGGENNNGGGNNNPPDNQDEEIDEEEDDVPITPSNSGEIDSDQDGETANNGGNQVPPPPPTSGNPVPQQLVNNTPNSPLPNPAILPATGLDLRIISVYGFAMMLIALDFLTLGLHNRLIRKIIK